MKASKKSKTAGQKALIKRHVINSTEAEIGRKGDYPMKADDPTYQKHVEFIYQQLLIGMSLQEIHCALILRDKFFDSHPTFRAALNHAYKFGETELLKDREYTFLLHMEKYEKIFQESMFLTNKDGFTLDKEKEQDNKIIVNKMKDAMKALRGKESLIGLHDKNMVIEITNQHAQVVNTAIKTTTGIGGYDFDKLSVEQLRELLELLNETRTVPLEGILRLSVTQNKYTEDEEVVQETTQIDDIRLEYIDDSKPTPVQSMQIVKEKPKEPRKVDKLADLPALERLKARILKAQADEYRENNKELLERLNKGSNERPLV